MVRALGRLAATLALVTAGAAVFAYEREPAPVLACGAAGPFDFDTVEAEDYLGTYATAIELVAAGKAVTQPLVIDGEQVDLRYQGVAKGPRSARSSVLNTDARIPPVLFKSIVWLESHWNNAVDAVPYGGVGPIIRSFDCGYGLAQVTTGMANQTGNPAAKQAAVGTHFIFNLSEGVRILADKWNQAPRSRPIAGDGNPVYLEDWYYAIWSYNGFAWSNHPLNPDKPALRPPLYHCDQEGAKGYGQYYRSDYTYTELVYGCVKNPPKRGPIGNPGGNPKVAFWPSQDVNMPDFSLKGVAEAFEPEHFWGCADGSQAACAKMDFPTTILKPEPAVTPTPTPTPTATPSETASPTSTPTRTPTPSVSPTAPPTPLKPILPHQDTTAPVDPARAAEFLGSPVLTVSGPRKLELETNAAGKAGSAALTVENFGGGIGPYRIRVSAPWILVKPNESSSRTLDGGVAIGRDTEVVTQAAGGGKPRVAQRGYKSQLVITFDPGAMPGSQAKGKVWIEPLYGNGEVTEIAIEAQAGPPDPYPYKAFIPGVTG
ncbi:MAG: hypothetical protein ACKVVT_04895 [Dehalococcoidia bacterium]